MQVCLDCYARTPPVATLLRQLLCLLLQAFLLTQDLSKARLSLWVVGAHHQLNTNDTKWFFEAFSEYITLRTFDYAEMVKGTTWEHDPFFGNAELVAATVTNPACYSDLVSLRCSVWKQASTSIGTAALLSPKLSLSSASDVTTLNTVDCI